jgi:small subunit ribosomal protein S16
LSVKIRLKKMGSKKRPFFRIVAADSRSPRDGRFIEALGYYNPMTDPPEIKCDDDKVFKWLSNGAIPTGNAAQLLKRIGLIEKWQLLRSGVKISELDATIEMRREKQPKAVPKTGTKPSKKEAAKAKAAEEETKAEKAAAEETEAGKAEPADAKPEAESVAEDEPAAADEAKPEARPEEASEEEEKTE